MQSTSLNDQNFTKQNNNLKKYICVCFRPKPKQGHTSPSSKDSKQVKRSGGSSVSPQRSDGLLHVTLTAKHNVQEHEKKMRVIEVSQQHCTSVRMFVSCCAVIVIRYCTAM